MSEMGISDTEQSWVFRQVAAVLHLGNCQVNNDNYNYKIYMHRVFLFVCLFFLNFILRTIISSNR